MDINTAVLEIQKARKEGKGGRYMPYAEEYANEMPHMEGYELQIQALYVLGNLTYWRGNTAQEVRSFLKSLTKVT